MIPDYCNLLSWSEIEEGFFISNEEKPGTEFSEGLQDTLFELEENSWWFQYRSKVVISTMDRFFSKNAFTLDIGAGNGYTSAIAMHNGYCISILEPSYSACVHARNRNISSVLCGSITSESIVDHSIDQILLLDCLEHIERDNDFLLLLNKKMKRDGLILITVPAFMSLWSSEDESAGHFRRYQRSKLEIVMKDSGFDVVWSSYFMSFLYFPVLFIRVWLERLGIIKKTTNRTIDEDNTIKHKEFIASSKLINLVLHVLEHREENKLLKRKKILFGSIISIISAKQEAY